MPRQLMCSILLFGLAGCATSDGNPDASAQVLIEALGPQQTFARLGWQVEPDYKPAEHCFNHWHERADAQISESEITDCDLHAQDLSRLYASYGTDAPPSNFKSEYYWQAYNAYSLDYPGLVEHWISMGGSEDDASFLDHPVCADTLQQGWAGSDYFWDGAEHPLCRLYKVEAIEAAK